MKNKFIFPVVFFIIISIISCKKESGLSSETVTTQSKIDLLEKPETQPAIQSHESVNVDANIGGYLEALPFGYKTNRDKHYPLIIFLHGLGELGNGTSDLYKVEDNAIPKLLANKTFPPNFVVGNRNFSFIVLSPQFKAWPQPADVNDMINYAISHYKIDTARMFVSGLSMGGGVTWDYTIDYGKRLAAIVPISGASWPTTDKAQKIAQANVAVWAFHNNDDSTVPSWYSINYVSYINSFNPLIPAKLTLWSTGGHDAWTKATDPAYKENGKNIYEWMLSYKKKP